MSTQWICGSEKILVLLSSFQNPARSSLDSRDTRSACQIFLIAFHEDEIEPSFAPECIHNYCQLPWTALHDRNGPFAPFGVPCWKPFLNFLAVCFKVLILPVPVVFLCLAFAPHSSIEQLVSDVQCCRT